MIHTTIETPFGLLFIQKSEKGVNQVLFIEPDDPRMCNGCPSEFENEIQQITEYFQGRRHTFDFPLEIEGTDFQKRVYQQLLTIPYGTLTTYGALANALGDPNASRAVGGAVGKNPIGIIVPCHRVIGKNGTLTGYTSIGGIHTKKQLLALEGSYKGDPLNE